MVKFLALALMLFVFLVFAVWFAVILIGKARGAERSAKYALARNWLVGLVVSYLLIDKFVL